MWCCSSTVVGSSCITLTAHRRLKTSWNSSRFSCSIFFIRDLNFLYFFIFQITILTFPKLQSRSHELINLVKSIKEKRCHEKSHNQEFNKSGKLFSLIPFYTLSFRLSQSCYCLSISFSVITVKWTFFVGAVTWT